MKGFLRRPWVQAALGRILAGYLILIRRTTRWRHEGLEALEPMFASGQGAIGLFWHGRIPVCLGMAETWWRKSSRRSLVSPSADGEFVALALNHIGFPAIRMSTAKKGDSAKARAAVAAFRDAIQHVASGGVLIITPDGPRGPNEVIAPGALQIARRTGAPVFLTGLAVAPSLRLASLWDRVMIAAPFGRGVCIWEGPFHVPPDADEALIDSLRLDWSARMAASTRRAEADLGLRPVDPPPGG